MNRKLFVVIMLIVIAAMSFNVLAQDEIVRGGVFTVSEGQQSGYVANFNPYAPDPTRWTQGTMYEPMIVYNPVEGGLPTPWLATDFAWADDLLSITYTLREGVKWSDGEDFNADDVVFTFEMFQKVPSTDTAGLSEFFAGVEKIDDYTVVIHMTKVYSEAAAIIGERWIVPEHIFGAVEDLALFTNPNPVATGPLTEVTVVDEQVLEICRNPSYWQVGADGETLPYVDCMRMPVYEGNDPANFAAANGDLDWIGNFIPDIENVFVNMDEEHHFYYFWPGGGIVQLYFNTEKAPFSDVAFRRALSAAIDYAAVTTIGMYGYTDPANATGLGPRHEAWISQDALDKAAEYGLNEFNPDAAMAALDAAGYVDADGDGWRDMPDGSALAIDVQVVDGWTDWVTSVDIMTRNFQDIGLNASMSALDFGAWFNNLQMGTYDTSIGWSTSANTPWSFFRNQLYSPLIVGGQANAETWSRWTSPETDALIDAFVATVDLDEQKEIVNQLQMTLVENVWAVPLFPGPTWYEYTTHRFTGFPTEDNYYTQGSPWNWQGRLLTVLQIHCIDEAACEAAK